MVKVVYHGGRGFAFFSFKFACLLKVSVKISGRRSSFSVTPAELSSLKNNRLYVVFVVLFEVVIFVSCSSSLDNSMEAVEFILLYYRP